MIFLKNQFLELTFNLLKENKLKKFSVREICSKLNQCHTTFYSYYQSRNDFLLDLLIFIASKLNVYKLSDLKNLEFLAISLSNIEIKNAIKNLNILVTIEEIKNVLYVYLIEKYPFTAFGKILLENYLRNTLYTIQIIAFSKFSKNQTLLLLKTNITFILRNS